MNVPKCTIYSTLYIDLSNCNISPILYRLHHWVQWFIQIFTRLIKCWRIILKGEIMIFFKFVKIQIIRFSIGPSSFWRSYKKIWAWLVRPFWRLLDTNKQTDTLIDKQSIYIDFNSVLFNREKEEKVKNADYRMSAPNIKGNLAFATN